jgi:predicted HD phosphohydrolase
MKRPTGERDTMQTVSFAHMTEATREDFELCARDLEDDAKELPNRILKALAALEANQGPIQVTRLEHSLQSATHAYNDGREEDYVVAALVHDIGDQLAPYTHGSVVAAILRPFVSQRICWVIEHHGLFQTYYSAHFFGQDRNARDVHKDNPYYEDCVEFCERYDQNCFDPDFESLPLEFFAPMVQRVFSRPPKPYVIEAVRSTGEA